MLFAVCDDDSKFVEQLIEYTGAFFKQNHLVCPQILVYNSGEALLKSDNCPDLVFLDIEMPGLNGISVGNELKRRNNKIIIIVITAYAEYLDEAMRFRVFRYLSKPLEKHRFFRNLKDALQVYQMNDTKIPIETKQNVYIVTADDIVFVEAINKKVIVHTLSADYESIRAMPYWLETLPVNCFFQSHRSFIVNMAHISDFDHTIIHLRGNQFMAYLTRRKYTAFKNAYMLYLESVR